MTYDVFQAYLHSRDIIHRDLNSHNCLIKEVNINKFVNARLTQFSRMVQIGLPWGHPRADHCKRAIFRKAVQN